MEKEPYSIGESAPNDNGDAHYAEPSADKHGQIAEAAELYGNLQTAEEYGYVTRGYVELCCNPVRREPNNNLFLG